MLQLFSIKGLRTDQKNTLRNRTFILLCSCIVLLQHELESKDREKQRIGTKKLTGRKEKSETRKLDAASKEAQPDSRLIALATLLARSAAERDFAAQIKARPKAHPAKP